MSFYGNVKSHQTLFFNMNLGFSRFNIILFFSVCTLSGCNIFSIYSNNYFANSIKKRKNRNYKFNYDIAYQPHNQQNSIQKLDENSSFYKKTHNKRLNRISKNNSNEIEDEESIIQSSRITQKINIRGNDLMIDTFYQRIIVDNKEIFSVDTVVISNTKLFNSILSWLGTKYRYGGTTHENVDCSALTRSLIVSTFNKMVPRTSIEQFRTTKVIEYKDLKEGDLIFFATHRKKRVSHVGMYLGNNYFIHAGTSSGVTLSSLITPYWKAHLIGYGRYYFQ